MLLNVIQSIFSTNEILTLILDYLCGHASVFPKLGSCILVNRKFYHEGIRIQWRTMGSRATPSSPTGGRYFCECTCVSEYGRMFSLFITYPSRLNVVPLADSPSSTR